MTDIPTLQRRVGVIGDVHGEDAALEAVLAFLTASGPLDAILCTGDIPDAKMGVGDTERCCRLLEAAGVLTIRGNHDRWHAIVDELTMPDDDDQELSPEAERFLRSLPPTRDFETPQGRLLFCHGIGRDDMSGIYPGGEDAEVEQALERHGLPGPYRLMLSGHTHRRMVRPLFANRFTLLNAGTLQWAYDPCFAILDLARGVMQFYDLTPLTNEITAAETLALFP